jgi:type I restriction enzyme S subunit
MSYRKTTTLGELMIDGSRSLDPSRFPTEVFNLYSIPAFDSGKPEIATGSEIGSTKQIVQPQDVLLSKIVPHIRRAWVVDKNNGNRQIASGEWIVFRSSRVYPDFLKRLLVSDHFHQEFMKTVAGVGGSLLRARPAQVAEIQIDLPPLTEQKRIAAILDEADALRRRRREVITRLDMLLQSVFLDMFGDLASNTKNWNSTSLVNILTFLTSGSRGWAAHYSDKGSLFLRIQNVVRGTVQLDNVAYVQVPDGAEARRTKVQPGDVLISITADLGRTGVVPTNIGDAYINQHLVILRVQGINPTFLSALLASPFGQRQFQAMNRQGVKAGLNFDDIKSLTVFTPPLELQEQYQAVSAQVTQHRNIVLKGLAEIESLFASLQHQAFHSPQPSTQTPIKPCLTLDF